MFINRGLPGSGKSTLSKRIKYIYETTVICSADDYFMDSNDNYNFDINKRPQAHQVAKEKAEKTCR
jgi:uridine kinase